MEPSKLIETNTSPVLVATLEILGRAPTVDICRMSNDQRLPKETKNVKPPLDITEYDGSSGSIRVRQQNSAQDKDEYIHVMSQSSTTSDITPPSPEHPSLS
jgi:hypothetical protein